MCLRPSLWPWLSGAHRAISSGGKLLRREPGLCPSGIHRTLNKFGTNAQVGKRPNSNSSSPKAHTKVNTTISANPNHGRPQKPNAAKAEHDVGTCSGENTKKRAKHKHALMNAPTLSPVRTPELKFKLLFPGGAAPPQTPFKSAWRPL
jgi:hypothetical protein